jgi:hypothetical protein
MTISASDFDIIDRQEVRHRQTGATWVRMATDTVGGRSLQEQPGKAGDGRYPTLAELRPYAIALLDTLADEATGSGSVRNRFTHGRMRAVPAAIKKPPHPTSSTTALDMGARLLARARKQQEEIVSKFVHDPASHFPGVGGTTATLSKERKRASLQTRGADQSRLVVRGCGPVPARMPKRKAAIVEMVALGKHYRLAGRGITCDGEMVLPKSTTQVRLELIDLAAEIEVTVEPRPQGSRKKYGPKRWIKRRTERPVTGRWRRPKPSI